MHFQASGLARISGIWREAQLRIALPETEALLSRNCSGLTGTQAS